MLSIGRTRAKPLKRLELFSRTSGIVPVFELGIEPGAGVSPVSLGGWQRDLEHLGDLGHGQSGEEAERGQIGLRKVFAAKPRWTEVFEVRGGATERSGEAAWYSLQGVAQNEKLAKSARARRIEK